MTKPVKPPVGAFSKDRNLLAATVDQRSKIGRLYRATVADLSDQIGAPTAAQSLIIQSAVLKSCRLYLMSERFLQRGESFVSADEKALAWLNSLRLDLMALGLDRRPPKDLGPTLGDILRAHAEPEFDPVNGGRP